MSEREMTKRQKKLFDGVMKRLEDKYGPAWSNYFICERTVQMFVSGRWPARIGGFINIPFFGRRRLIAKIELYYTAYMEGVFHEVKWAEMGFESLHKIRKDKIIKGLPF